MSETTIRKTFNGWYFVDSDGNEWSFSEFNVDGFVDALSEAIDLPMVLAPNNPYYSPKQPTQPSTEEEVGNPHLTSPFTSDGNLYEGTPATFPTEPIEPLADLDPSIAAFNGSIE